MLKNLELEICKGFSHQKFDAI